VQIFYAVYAYNVGVEKKNLRAMLEIIGAASSGAQGMDFSESLKSGGTNRKNGYTPLYPDNEFLPRHLKRSTDGTKSDASSEKKNGSEGGT
jgi:hypothetical protein